MKPSLVAAAGAAAALALTPAVAHADPSPVSPLTRGSLATTLRQQFTARPSQTVATGLLTPLSVAMAPKGEIYFSQNFAGKLDIVGPDRKVKTIFSAQGEVGAVSVRGARVTFAVTAQTSTLRKMERGKVSTTANLSAYETKYNPDGKQTYGVPDLPASCVKQVPKQYLPISYKGMNDNSHPYATYYDGHNTYVADAGANTILKVTDSGKISTVAVLPPVPQKITAADVQSQPGLPTCLIGHTFYAEGVPTGITMSPKGQLLVSQLPGGFGHDGSVWQINPRTGAKKAIAKGLGGITSISVSPGGQIYLTSLFAGQVLRLPACGGKPVVLQQVAMPGAVAWTPKGLLVTADVMVGAGDPESGQPSTEAPGGKVLLYGLYPGKKCPRSVSGGMSAMCRM